MSMFALVSAVFVASLFGSLHCVGMCGPLALLASSHLAPETRRSSLRRFGMTLVYHASRSLAYAVAGAVVGFIGAGIESTGTVLGLQQFAARLAGGSMLVIGMLSLVNLAGGTPHTAWLPAWLQRRLSSAHQWARRQRPVARATMIGLLTAILPCGWLFAFLIVAAGTAHPVHGALVMLVFAMGSVPALTALAMSTALVVGRIRTLVPWFSALLVTIVGGVTLSQRAAIQLQPIDVRPMSIERLSSSVSRLDHSQLPCCAATTESATQPSEQKDR